MDSCGTDGGAIDVRRALRVLRDLSNAITHEDDRGYGELIICTGAGGRTKTAAKWPTGHFRAQNLALFKSAIDAIERGRGVLDAFYMRSEAGAAQ
jgi:hypothetical protein